jgi:hypothetical protein
MSIAELTGPTTPERWVEKVGRSIKGSDTPQYSGSGRFTGQPSSATPRAQLFQPPQPRTRPSLNSATAVASTHTNTSLTHDDCSTARLTAASRP